MTQRILKLGFPSLLTQSLTALVQIVLNNLMRVYGAASITAAILPCPCTV